MVKAGADDSGVLTETVPSPGDSASHDSASGDSASDDSGSDDSAADDSAPDTSWVRPPRPDTDHPGEADSWRWGGGADYPDMVDPSWPVVTWVDDLSGLTSAIAGARAGDIVYVDDTAALDLTGQSLCIPAGVWLASGRGRTEGALLYVTQGASTPMLQACGDDVRITGLRLRGPDPETCPSEWPDDCPNDVSGDVNCAYCTTTAYGVGTSGYAGLEVDNNELSGWTYTAVGVHDAVGADIHHNHIHHGWREGLGYGVVIYGSGTNAALIRWNRLDAMRHAVAAQGYPTEDYEARDNLVGTAANGHVFDVHGQNEATGDGSSYAGGDIRVHRNVVLVDDQPSFVVRGRPETGAWLYDNCLAPSENEAYDQRYFTGNLFVDEDPSGASAPNLYGQSVGDCATLHWCLVDGGDGPLRYGSATGTPAADLLIGDLDGDGHDDVFNTSGGAWRWANPDGGTWTALATSSAALSELHLADLDGDGVDDVFWASGEAWYWSRSGVSSWATLKVSSYGSSEVLIGDFDGDGADDVFTTDGQRWAYHPRGSGDPLQLASSGNALSSLALGDFDGDGVTDVFTGDGVTWKWSRSGTSSWSDLARSSSTVADLAFADVDGDRITDVISVSNQTLRYSSGGQRSWETLRYQVEGLDGLRLGDFDGDGRDDVLVGECP